MRIFTDGHPIEPSNWQHDPQVLTAPQAVAPDVGVASVARAVVEVQATHVQRRALRAADGHGVSIRARHERLAVNVHRVH